MLGLVSFRDVLSCHEGRRGWSFREMWLSDIVLTAVKGGGDGVLGVVKSNREGEQPDLLVESIRLVE